MCVCVCVTYLSSLSEQHQSCESNVFINFLPLAVMTQRLDEIPPAVTFYLVQTNTRHPFLSLDVTHFECR